MSEAFLKGLRWYFIVVCTIIGTTSFILADEWQSIKPVGIGILAYGTVYIMTVFWKDVRGKLLAANVGCFFLLTVLSSYVPDILYVLFALDVVDIGAYLDNRFVMWATVEAVIGIPVMAVIFYMYD